MDEAVKSSAWARWLASKSIMSLWFDIDGQGLGVVRSYDLGGDSASFDGKFLMLEGRAMSKGLFDGVGRGEDVVDARRIEG